MVHARLRSLLILLLVLALTAPIHLTQVRAVDSCTASVSPQSVEGGTSAGFYFSLKNTGDAEITYIKITRPSVNFSLFNNGGIPSPWIVSASTSIIETYNGTVAPGATFNFSIGANIEPKEASSTDWTVETIAGSSPLTRCPGGPFGTAIVGVADTTAPVISSPTVSNVTSSTTTISWTSNEAAASYLNYGLSYGDYGTHLHDSRLKTSHSFKLTGLIANTTYFYEFRSVDASDNTTPWSDYHSFTTAATTPTPTPTPSPTPTPTPTPTPADSTPPNVRLTTSFSKPFEQAPRIKGKAVDNKVIEKIEYSTDGGVNWLPVDKLTKPGGKSTSFSFTPTLFDDGNYKIIVRAADGSNNWGVSKTYTLVIDRLPPTVGSALISVGPLVLTPNQDGNLVTVSGIEHRITLSAVGGPTSIDLLVNDHMHSLSRSSETGLWNGAVIFDQPGSYKLTVKSKDGAGNVIKRQLTNVVVLKPGTVEGGEEGTITVYYQEPTSKVWHLWDAKSFSQTNPQSFKDGTYKFFLPPGVYYLRVESPGYKTVTSNIFQLDAPAPINTDFTLEKPSRINIFNISFISKEVVIQETQDSFKENSLLDKPAPIFFLPALEGTFESVALRGRPSVLSFVNTWSGPSVEQISILDKFPRPNQLGTIIVQENPSRAKIFAERGEYDLNLAIDQEGQLVDDFNIFTLPTHVFLDKKGVIKRVVPGVLNVEEIEEILLEVFRELLEY